MGKQNEKLLKNIKRYEQKKKIEQQESKILGQKPGNRKTNSKKKAKQQEPEIYGQKPIKGKTNKEKSAAQ